jgi:hypothetical protein
VGNYDEMSTARLTWVVLDRLVPGDEVSAARAALIARDPELESLVAQGVMSEIEAVEALRSRQSRYGSSGRAPGDGRSALLVKRLAALGGAGLVATTLLHLAR